HLSSICFACGLSDMITFPDWRAPAFAPAGEMSSAAIKAAFEMVMGKLLSVVTTEQASAFLQSRFRRMRGEFRSGARAVRAVLAALSLRLVEVEQLAPATVHVLEQFDGVGAPALEVAVLELHQCAAVRVLEAHLDGRLEVGIVLEIPVQLPGKDQPTRPLPDDDAA